MKYDFNQAKQKVADKYNKRDWTALTWDSDRGGYDEVELYKEAAEIYADQFKIKLSPDRVLTQEEFNKQYSHYQDILVQQDVAGFWQESFNIADAERNKLKEVATEPTEEEIMEEALSANKALSSVQTNFIDGFHYAINWYKQKTNRK